MKGDDIMIYRMSKMTGRTLKEQKCSFSPESQNLLFRANYFKEIAPGGSMHFSRGVKLVERMESLIEDVLKEAGCELISLPFQESGKAEFPGFMEAVIENEMKSYKDYPTGFYFKQIGNNIEFKANSGVYGGKYFHGTKLWRFFESIESNKASFEALIELLIKKMDEIGIKAEYALASKDKFFPGIHGVLWFENQSGDTDFLACQACGYRAMDSMAEMKLPDAEAWDDKMPQLLHTPQVKTIKELCEFAKVSEKKLAKAIAVSAGGRLLVLMMRGDRTFNPHKLAKILEIDVGEIKMADEEEIEEKIGSKAGFIGPVGLKAEVWADSEIPLLGSMIVGANKRDYHLKNVLYGRDYKASRVEDIVYARENDLCPVCGKSLKLHKGFCLGQFTNYGEEFSKTARMTFLNANGKATAFSCHEGYLNIYSLIGAACENNRDESGICWPEKVSPYDIHVLVLNSKKEEQKEFGEKVAKELSLKGLDIILDDRSERAGFKFKDCELLGIPRLVVVGNKAAEGFLEYRDRKSGSKSDMTYNELMEMANL